MCLPEGLEESFVTKWLGAKGTAVQRRSGWNKLWLKKQYLDLAVTYLFLTFCFQKCRYYFGNWEKGLQCFPGKWIGTSWTYFHTNHFI